MFKFDGREYGLILVDVRQNCVTRLLECRVTEPIFHPASDNRFGDNYGKIYGFDKKEIADLITNPAIAVQTYQNWAAAKLFEENKKEFYEVNRKIAKITQCGGCEKEEPDRSLLFACCAGDVFHKQCLYDENGRVFKNCPTCNCPIL